MPGAAVFHTMHQPAPVEGRVSATSLLATAPWYHSRKGNSLPPDTQRTGVTSAPAARCSPAFHESLGQSPHVSNPRSQVYVSTSTLLRESSSNAVIFCATHQALLCCQCWISAQRSVLQLLAGFSSLGSALGSLQGETQNWGALVHYQ